MKIQVTFSKDQMNILRQFKGTIGENDAEIVRNIVLSWLAEKSFISEVVKSKMVFE